MVDKKKGRGTKQVVAPRPVAKALDQNPTSEIMGLRNSCSSTGCGVGDMVPDRSGKYSRGQQMFQIGCVPTYALEVGFTKPVPKGIADRLIELGCTLRKNVVTITGNGPVAKDVRSEIGSACTAGTDVSSFAAKWDLLPLGYNGVRNLALALRDSEPVNKLFGLSHDLAPETVARLEAARTLAEFPAGHQVPMVVTFTASVPRPTHVFALHRLVNAYVGRSGFSRTSPKLTRDASAASVKKHLNGSQGWLRIFKDSTVRGDDIATDMLNARAHRALNPDK